MASARRTARGELQAAPARNASGQHRLEGGTSTRRDLCLRRIALDPKLGRNGERRAVRVSLEHVVRLPEFRGRLYEYSTARDEYVLTDTSAPATTHLNLQFAAQFSGDYPDRELFSTLEFGVDFDADNLEMQVVLPPHLLSLAGGLSKVQSDIAGRAGRGWYEVFDRMPFNPWRPQQMGSRPKPNGKYRVIVNASFPHSELADDYGVRTHSLNSLSKRSYDAVRGSDGKRMCRMLAMVRVTARSPPPQTSLSPPMA